MTQLEKNKAELLDNMREMCNNPLNRQSASALVDYMAVYDALCRVSCIEAHTDHYDENTGTKHTKPRLDRQTAEQWMSHMLNADETSGPHWTMEKAEEVQKKFGLDYDPTEFWAALNASYSDLSVFFQKHNINTLDAYVDYTVTFWFKDKDAVADKLEMYYKYVVRH